MKNYQGESLFLVQLIVLVFFNTFQRSQFDVLHEIGLLSINLTLFMMFLLDLRQVFGHKKIKFFCTTTIHGLFHV
ncbi:hypothetical protein, partial [Oceanobacillus caeni]|uniref:hypothetical protein n=1 Tax=Oceanobacillus caeni TaxID=405946 RepID=UPI00363EAD97